MAQKQIITITSLSSTGEGVGSLEGMKIFVEGALPGETVSIQVTEQKKTYAKATVLSILTPSPDRQEPPCPVFGVCGGCQIMHLNYLAQLELKRKRVVDALERIGHFDSPSVLPCLPSPLAYGYRNKIQLPLIWEKENKRVGLYRKNSHEIIPVKRCLIQCPQGEKILSFISDRLNFSSVRYVLIRNAVFNEEALVIFITTGEDDLRPFAKELMANESVVKGVVENINRRSDNSILTPHFRLLAGNFFIYETLLNKRFKISPSAFFQINPLQTEKLYEMAIELAEIKPNEEVLDAFCGVGALAILAAGQAKRAWGIECIQQAIADAKENATMNHLSNCFFTCGMAENLIKKYSNLATVFLNPPRKGCAPELLAALTKKRPKKLIYISCDPATLARDLAMLRDHYQPDFIQPFDMFPQTMHVETVVRLIRMVD
jgi:23S rRNA (uracil1939-C5)-methyltransferase